MKLIKRSHFSEPKKTVSQSLPNTYKRKWFQNQKLKIEIGNPFEAYTIKQKEFTKPRPVREYTRFPKSQVALSGMNPSRNYQEFINKDIVRPLIRPNLYENFDNKNKYSINIDDSNSINPSNRSMKWALKTVARVPNYELLPKIQQFQTYYFPPEYNVKDVDKYRNFSLKTDHIGIKVPRIKKAKSNRSIGQLKSEYYFNTTTREENKWVPYHSKDAINNLSSKNYNIINFQPVLTNNSNLQIMNKTLYDRKKGIGEYADLTKPFRINFNQYFADKFNENPFRFRRFNGIFSNMYNSSRKNGNIIPPFGNSKKH